MSNSLLLDTHIWLWLMIGDRALAKSALTHIRATIKEHHLYIPTISLWEVAMLEAKGKIALGCSTHDWIAKALSTPGIALAPLSPEIAIDSCHLPDDFHKDPADRIIVATSRKMNLPLVTQDDRILRYSKHGYLQTIKG